MKSQRPRSFERTFALYYNFLILARERYALVIIDKSQAFVKVFRLYKKEKERKMKSTGQKLLVVLLALATLGSKGGCPYTRDSTMEDAYKVVKRVCGGDLASYSGDCPEEKVCWVSKRARGENSLCWQHASGDNHLYSHTLQQGSAFWVLKTQGGCDFTHILYSDDAGDYNQVLFTCTAPPASAASE